MNQPSPTLGSTAAHGEDQLRPNQLSGMRLAGYAFLILFLELALIRYVSAYVRVFGFYLNMVLIATFLGMGVGLLRASAALTLRWLFLPALPMLLGAVHFFANAIVRPPADPDEFIWGVFFELAPTVRQVGITPTVIILFALCALVMVPLGALLGREFRKWMPLTAYSFDIVGSVLGIATFALVSTARVSPALWFALAYAVWVLLSLEQKRYAAVVTLSAIPSLWLVVATAGPKPEFWSPYYRINVLRGPAWHSIHVNGSMHQWVLDYAAERENRAIAEIRESYQRPLRLAARLDTALVVGAGSGNDVVNLLKLGAKHIDAVEIDPVILDIGRVLHPQAPYADPRVTAVVEDARAFLRRVKRRYDVIVFGTLDSQTLLSGMSSVRLDNYVYTVEAFRAARDRLTPGGILVTYHMSHTPYIAAKIDGAIASAFGRAPLVYKDDPFHLFNYTFVIGGRADSLLAQAPPRELAQATLPRDDWPYLYLSRRTVPTHYLLVLGGILLTGLLFLGLGAPRAVWSQPDGAMFFLGAGFLLLETKSVTEMSLLFGSTWQVNLLVFSSILLCILAANVIVSRRSISVRGCFAGLFVSLAAAYALQVQSLLFIGETGQWLLGGTLVALPVFFAGMIFASLFKERLDPVRALGFNLLGAIVGGVLEYLSMVVGTKGLYLLAAAVYACAYVAHRRSVTRASELAASVHLDASREAA